MQSPGTVRRIETSAYRHYHSWNFDYILFSIAYTLFYTKKKCIPKRRKNERKLYKFLKRYLCLHNIFSLYNVLVMPESEPDTDFRTKFMLQNWNTLYMGYFSLILLPFRRMFHIIISFSSDCLRKNIFQIFKVRFCHHLSLRREMFSGGFIEAAAELFLIGKERVLMVIAKAFSSEEPSVSHTKVAISIPLKTVNEEQQVLDALASPLNSRQTNCGDRECHLGESEIHFL